MSADTAEEVPRPPGRRSIHLYGPPPTSARSAALSTAFGNNSGIATPRNGARGADASAAGQQRQQQGLPPSGTRRCISAVSLTTAAGSGTGAAGSVDTTNTATAFPRQLRGRLNEGTVHRIPQPPQPFSAAAGGRPATHVSNPGSGKGPRYGSSVVSWVPVAAAATRNGGNGQQQPAYTNEMSVTSSYPQSRRSRDNTAAAIAEMVNEASLRNTWAMRFDSTAALRQAVTTDADAYTVFEDALVEELNTLRRAPAAYASVVEHEARLGAPYVFEDDTYFASEAAAEDAALVLRKKAEQETAQEVTLSTVTGGSGLTTGAASTALGAGRLVAATANASNVSPKHGAPGTVNAGAPSSPTAADRKKGKKRFSGNAAGTPPAKDPATPATSAKDGVLQPFASSPLLPQPDGAVFTAATSRHPSLSPAGGMQELTLAELRHQFRCQQRYRAALETAVRELRAAQRQAVAAQLAAWSAEDEKAQKRARRFTAQSLVNPAAAANAASSNATSITAGGGGASGTNFSSSNSKRKASASMQRRGSPAMDENAIARRSEEATLIHRAYEQRVHHLELELQRARGTCQRSLAGGNLISSAVRALRSAQPVPPLKCSRGLSLAARDTAEVYYGDEERVAALSELCAISRASLVGLTDSSGGASPKKSGSAADTIGTLEELSVRREQHLAESVMDADVAPPAGVLPVLSEEALLLAQVAQKACTTYGYISNEIRGVHLQGVGTPRALLLQLLVGSLSPVVGIAQQQSTATTAATTAVGAEAGTQCFAGMRLEGRIYAAQPGSLPRSSSERGVDDAGAAFLSDSAAAGAADGHAWAAGEATDDAALRLWPLLWPAASTIGCGWQQVRGWRHVPTYAEACQKIVAERDGQQMTRASNASTQRALVAVGESAVVCSTLLLASGFEEYEVGRACHGMTPAATRRVVQGVNSSSGNGVDDDTDYSGGNGGGAMGATRTRGSAAGARRAAIEVHSSLGVSLISPTMHPLLIPMAPARSPHGGGTSGSSSATASVVCVAVRVPNEKKEGRKNVPVTIRVVAQVARQGDPTPLCPSADAAEVLAQRSPVDPSVWLVLVDAAAAFARREGRTQTTASRGVDVGDADASLNAAGTALALHLFAKDEREAIGGYEHVAFIRLQRVAEEEEADGVAEQGQRGQAGVLIAPEWRHLLKGLSCVPAASTAGQNRGVCLPPRSGVACGGWAVLHEPLLGRDGILLSPLAADFRASTLSETTAAEADNGAREGAFSLFTAFADTHQVSTVTAAAGAAIPATTGEGIRVAVQLPAHANALWWRHRVAVLHAARDKLAAEMVAEEEGEKGKGVASEAGEEAAVAESAGPQRSLSNSASLSPANLPSSLSATAAGTSAAAVATAAAAAAAAAETSAAHKKPSTARPASREAASVGENGEEAAKAVKAGEKGASRTIPPPAGSVSAASVLSSSPMAKARASFSGAPSTGTRRVQTVQVLTDAPQSAALSEYGALLTAASFPGAASGAAVAVNAIGVHPSLQASCIALAALRSLHDRLRADAAVWQTYSQRIQPILDGERERLAGEAAKRKGKEQQRLQHDQDDVVRELAEVQRRADEFSRAVSTTYDALRKRERAQVLRRGRFERVTADLAKLEAAAAAAAATIATATTEGNAQQDAVVFAAPRVTLRLFNSAAVAAGSGRRAATRPPSWQDSSVLTDAAVSAEGCLVSASSLSAAASADDVVVLQPQPPQAVSSMPGGAASVVYAASCTVPPSFSGQATLLIDDEVAVTWTL